MSTSRRTWQRRDAADLFGALRQVLSGSSGWDDRSMSDTTHDRLFIEVKLRGRHTARTLFDTVKARARKERKLPVLALADKGRPGFLLCVHSDDLDDLVAELARAKKPVGQRGTTC